MEQNKPSARQVVIAAEKDEKRDRIQRALELMLQNQGETEIDWHHAATTEAAIEQINLALANLKDVKHSVEILVAMSGFQGQWFEIAGYIKLIEATAHNSIKAVLMSGHPDDVQNAEREGLKSINPQLSEAEIAKYAAQILLGETVGSVQFTAGDVEQNYRTDDTFSQEPDKDAWDYLEFP